MVNTPRAEAPLYTEEQDQGDKNINEARLKIETGPTPVRILSLSVDDPGAFFNPVDAVMGDCVIVGTGTTGTDFFGHDGELAIFTEGWVFRSIKDREVIFDEETETYYRRDGSEWIALFEPFDGTARQTGRLGFAGTPKPLMQKALVCAGLPNTGSGNFAHGIGSLPVGKSKWLSVRFTASNGTTARICPYYDGTNRISVAIDATNVVVTTNFDASTWDGVAFIEWETP